VVHNDNLLLGGAANGFAFSCKLKSNIPAVAADPDKTHLMIFSKKQFSSALQAKLKAVLC
jgi:hypothetical protein